jgi:hypothetical protein
LPVASKQKTGIYSQLISVAVSISLHLLQS